MIGRSLGMDGCDWSTQMSRGFDWVDTVCAAFMCAASFALVGLVETVEVLKKQILVVDKDFALEYHRFVFSPISFSYFADFVLKSFLF